MAAAAGNSGGEAGAFILLALAVVAYWVPTAVAWTRRVPNAGAVTVINVFLGWTVVGWVVALAMACRSIPPEYP